jgi:1,4-alpha-glucan branching enzyme
LAFIRWSEDGQPLISVTNFSPVPHESYRLPLPSDGMWREILNTDDQKYGGSGVTNSSFTALGEESRGMPYSAIVRVPPLGTVWFTSL